MKGPISHGLDPRHGKGHLFKLYLQRGVFAISCGLRAKQPQASLTTHHSLISHLGVELLKQELLKVEQHGGIDVTNLLADELQLSTPKTQKSVSDRLSNAAAHQQLEVAAALIPLQGRLGKPRQEAQAVVTTSQAQFKTLPPRIQGHNTRQFDAG